MSTYKVKVKIEFDMEVNADSNAQAIKIAEETFQVEDFIDQLEENKKFTKAILTDIEDEDFLNDDLSDEDEDE